MFTAVLFTTAKIWKAFKFPSIDKWLKKMWHTYTQWNISHKKRRQSCHLQQHRWT